MNLIILSSRSINFSDIAKQKRMFKLILCLAIFLFVSVVSSAQTRRYVNQAVATSGDGSNWGSAFKTLSEAIKVASSNVTDEVWVAKGTYIPNTNHYGTRYDPPSFSNSMTFYLKKPISIYGGFIGTETTLAQRNWEANETILSGNINNPTDSTDNIYHVLLIAGTEAKPLKNVTVDGFTIRDGYANVITDITVDGNVVYAYNGGGVYNIFSSPELKNLKIIRNVGFVGGGIHNKNSSPKIDNCQILQNYSGSSGGGIYNLRGSPLIQNTLIANNYVNNIGGGGIDNASSNVTIKNSTIRNNRANRGGGIYSSDGNIQLENVLIENNNAYTDGGGMYNFSKTHLSLKHVTITGNQAQNGGGMRTFRAILQIDSSQFSNNSADWYGGGIFADGDSLQITNSNIDSNKTKSYSGAGLYAEAVFFTLKGGTIKGNNAKTDAGGIRFLKNSYGNIEDVEISNNTCAKYGGGIYLVSNSYPDKQFQFTNVIFSNNSAVSGGGIHLNSTSPKFESVSFINNISESSGAGLMAAAGAFPDLINCRFDKNKALYGGGLYSQNGASATLNHVSFLENEAINEGGGFYCGGNGEYNALNIKGNKAKNGGGAYISGPLNLTNALISGNYASENGGGIHIYYSAPVLTNNTVAGNNAVKAGGGIYSSSSNSSKIRNSVIHGNSNGLSGYMIASYSFIEGSSASTNGNIPGSDDPEFMEPHAYTNSPSILGNYFLKTTSPVVDKGDNSIYQPTSIPHLSTITTDLLGNSRFYNTTVDMGAFEYQPNATSLKLVSFEALLKNNTLDVSWKIMGEVNVSHFEIERSIDRISFEKVGVQEANGTGNYSFNDNIFPSGKIYYRLKIIDIDGNAGYSVVKAVSVPITGVSEITSIRGMIVYPVPSIGLIHIADKNKTLIAGLFRVFTTTGKIVIETDSNPVDIHSLPPGLYLIHATDRTGKFVDAKEIIKN